MNIKEAKIEIKNTVALYLEKNENGEYMIPTVRQRPVFLVGAPGIGKTAIMEQIAAELNIALVSYSMTHHTRQSAIGLPYLKEKTYGGRTVTVSEYTMSEIVENVYRVIEETGKKEGILFLDEINCVSETLAPAMLLFLQYKRFGNETIPEGWVVVTAGNPPQFNKSVREFDVATLDRLKYIKVEENYAIWKEYASAARLHPAIISFLDLNEGYFYKMATTVDGKQYITARGWEDLSAILRGYERNDFEITSSLIMQYITIPDVARAFAVYYSLFCKYRNKYGIRDILESKVTEKALKNAENARFDERLSVISLLCDMLSEDFQKCIMAEKSLLICVDKLRSMKSKNSSADELVKLIRGEYEKLETEIKLSKTAGSEDRFKSEIKKAAIRLFKKYEEVANSASRNGFEEIKKVFSDDVSAHENGQAKASSALHNAFEFIRSAWGEGQEMVLFVSELTGNPYSSEFIATWGSPDYYEYNQDLLVYDNDKSLLAEVEAFCRELAEKKTKSSARKRQ